MTICNNLFNITYICLKLCNYGNIMTIHNVAILHFRYNYIDKNKLGFGNWINVRNADP